MIDSDLVSELIKRNVESLIRQFFPAARKVGQEYHLGDVTGASGDSLKISVALGKEGLWQDWATSDCGDFVKLLMAKHGVAYPEAAHMIAAFLGHPIDQEQPKPSIDWQKCVAAFTDEYAQRFSGWRGLSGDYVRWLRDRQLIGIHKGYLAFPVRIKGVVVSAHYRIPPKNGEKPDWRYDPTGLGTQPFTIGDLEKAQTVHGFESQWDMFALDDRTTISTKPLPGRCSVPEAHRMPNYLRRSRAAFMR